VRINTINGETEVTIRITSLAALVGASLALAALPAAAQLSWDGQSGVFLNTLAFAAPRGSVQGASHYINLDPAGYLVTYGVAAGLRNGIEVGITRVNSHVTSVADQNVLQAKWQFVTETPVVPAAAAWATNRTIIGVGDATDVGITATKVLPVPKHPVIVSLGLRSTKALGNGLFGIAANRKVKWEGDAAVFVTSKLIVGGEFREQIAGRTWTDFAVRYLATDRLNVDVGVANFAPGLSSQVAAGLTWRF
jgi:hypothetical protein